MSGAFPGQSWTPVGFDANGSPIKGSAAAPPRAAAAEHAEQTEEASTSTGSAAAPSPAAAAEHAEQTEGASEERRGEKSKSKAR